MFRPLKKLNTNKQEDGMHFWKAEKEIITGHDWMALSDTEKTKLIQLSMDHIQSDGVVKLKRVIKTTLIY